MFYSNIVIGPVTVAIDVQKVPLSLLNAGFQPYCCILISHES